MPVRQEAVEIKLEDINNIISQLGCPNGGNFRKIDGGCYLFINEVMNYNDAKTLCENKIANGNPGYLVEPKTTLTSKLIFSEARTMFYPGYWIGVNDVDIEDIWSYSSTGVPATTTFFRSDQPNVDGDCVGTCDWYKWCDISCDNNNYFVICEF